jgi:hypothetical protein
LDIILVEDDDYVLINKTTWLLLLKLYQGGP